VSDCLFCRIVSGEIPAAVVFQDDVVAAFRDITPQAPMHVLIVPKRHIGSLNDLTPSDDQIVGRLVRTAASIAQEQGYGAGGYRTVFNCNADAGQTVFHIHLHLLAGRRMTWPPG
jgi:histidine triad (HIT) family protein